MDEYKIAEPGALYFFPDIEEGYVTKVYDGDTITVVAKLPSSYCGCHDPKKCKSNRFYKFKVRVAGIDTPELHAKSAEEQSLATLARDTLSKKILHKVVDLGVTGYDKYGRLLAQIHLKGEDIAKYMLDSKLALPYDGKKKATLKDFVQWHTLD